MSVLLLLCFISCDQRLRPVNPRIEYINYVSRSGTLELPLSGATGYAAINIPVFETANQNSRTIGLLSAGQGFLIIDEENDWLHIETDNFRGWVSNRFCMVNLPDVLPSIIYDNTNTYSSLFRSSGKDIPNITGLALYEAKDFNTRLGRDEYIAPVLYGMIRKIGAAQQAALADGNTLVIYEAFRPSDVHDIVYDNLYDLYLRDRDVRTGISTPPFNIRWFLAPAPYNHQRGTAIDVTLARVGQMEARTTGNYVYPYITIYTEYQMHTPMHELSIASVVFSSAPNSRSPTAWLEAEFADNVTAGTRLLHKYMTEAGLTPLASEWWHFNDLEFTDYDDTENVGKYFVNKTYSIAP